MSSPPLPRPARAAQAALAKQLGQIGFVLPGSLVDRWTRCGKASCRCRAEPPQLHGPYPQWSRTVEGKSTTHLLSPEQLERYRPWFEAARHLRELVRELETLGVEVAEAAEGWDQPGGRREKATRPVTNKARKPSP